MKNWVKRWNIPDQAVSELMQILAQVTLLPALTAPKGSEARVVQELRVSAPHHQGHLWRNNNGALRDERGNMIRYGLANESTRLNKVFKSSDLIGFTRIHDVAIFTAIEAKRPGWKAPTNERETAQAAFLKLVHAGGGIALFATAAAHYPLAIEQWRLTHE